MQRRHTILRAIVRFRQDDSNIWILNTFPCKINTFN